MTADLGPLSLTQLQQLAQQDPNPSPWMWNPRRAPDEDDSWEVRAFAEDTGNAMGSTWPPRSYTCTFCRREFRSAQALGGHMNVHRRDRARLHQSEPAPIASSSPLMFPPQEFVANGALCLLYPFPNPNPVFTPSRVMASSLDSPSTLLSISPYAANSLTTSRSLSIDCRSVKVEPTRPAPSGNNNDDDDDDDSSNESGYEELDLELRLGQRPSPH